MGEVLGEYPGVVGAAAAVWAKCCAPASRGALEYAFRCDSGRYLDPTDAAGVLPASELAWWGPLCVDATLARINEPTPRSGEGLAAAARRANVAVEEPRPAFGLLFDTVRVGVTRPVAAGEELMLSYGADYDRSGYGRT